MVTRPEQIFYAIMSVLFLTVYQAFFAQYVMAMMPSSGFAEQLIFNLIVWFSSFVFVLLLIRQIKKSREEKGEGA